MTPPAPMPELQFQRLLRDNGCVGQPKGSEYAVYRKTDGKLVSGYAVKHGSGGKREVKHPYVANFLKRLEALQVEDKNALEAAVEKTTETTGAWTDADWYKEQQKLSEQIDKSPETKEETS